MAVIHSTPPTVFSDVNRKARGTHTVCLMALPAEHQHDVNSAGHTVADGRKKEGARHGCFGQCCLDEQYAKKF